MASTSSSLFDTWFKKKNQNLFVKKSKSEQTFKLCFTFGFIIISFFLFLFNTILFKVLFAYLFVCLKKETGKKNKERQHRNIHRKFVTSNCIPTAWLGPLQLILKAARQDRVWAGVSTSAGKHLLSTRHWNPSPKGSCSTGSPLSLSNLVLNMLQPSHCHYVPLTVIF